VANDDPVRTMSGSDRKGREGDRMTGRVIGAFGGVVATIFVLAQFIFWVGSATGFVWQICLEPEGAAPARAEIEQGVVYVLFPPLILSSIDPPGSCVRNTPLHQGLSALGVWELPPPRVQVEAHLRSQERVRSGASTDRD
jgi:hypothetical protein